MAVGTAAHLPGDGNVVVATSSYVPMPAQPVAYDSSADAARAHKGVFGPYRATAAGLPVPARTGLPSRACRPWSASR